MAQILDFQMKRSLGSYSRHFQKPFLPKLGQFETFSGKTKIESNVYNSSV